MPLFFSATQPCPVQILPPATTPPPLHGKGRGGDGLQQQLLTSTQKMVSVIILTLTLLLSQGSAWATNVTILCYHRFGATVADSMTTRTSVFEQQLARLKQDGYTFVPLATAVAGLRGEAKLPAKPVVLTVDDGHRTVYSDLLPIIRREHLPVTLFIYPSAISNADYAMTWEQIKEVLAEPGVEVQSHTYWHPNFKTEKKRLAADEYQKLVRIQLEKSKLTLKKKLGVDPPYLAWPFGLYDEALEKAASTAGYSAALALGDRVATEKDSLLALPRYLIVDASGINSMSNMLRAGELKAEQR